MEAIKKQFTPEFRNRLDNVIQFKPLDAKTIAYVVDKFLFELEDQLHDKKVAISIDNSVREWLAEKGYDVLMGARPMARLIQDEIKKPLAEELLFGSLEEGGSVRITVSEEGTIEFQYETMTVH